MLLSLFPLAQIVALPLLLLTVSGDSAPQADAVALPAPTQVSALESAPLPDQPLAMQPVITGPASVWDGATLDVGGDRLPVVRLVGVKRPPLDHPLGLEGAQRLAALVGTAPLRCQLPVALDGGYGAVCALPDGRDPAALLVAKGLLILDLQTLPRELEARYSSASADARAASRGYWALSEERRPVMLGLRED